MILRVVWKYVFGKQSHKRSEFNEKQKTITIGTYQFTFYRKYIRWNVLNFRLSCTVINNVEETMRNNEKNIWKLAQL